MFVGRWVYSKGSSIDSLIHSELIRKRSEGEEGVTSTSFGCVLFLKDDIVECLQEEKPTCCLPCTEGDLLDAVVQWARGGKASLSENSLPHTYQGRSSFPSTTSGPWTVIERCIGDPCSFGVIAGFVFRHALSLDNGDNGTGENINGNPQQYSCGGGFLWEWCELINCASISQLSLYMDSVIVAKNGEVA
ncbi:uncharacterized protein TM35_000013560 [Trypanosoma theileri]|uniref:Uncharacterized protein n=1 Tax=Trypanosoma theileri TaxID=67003 RepID=A0A1X0PA61_9TRYP|nr:uncharacterized protein TM35_000013560 [Trypanosoma theileri]ORC93479.1 hypothetical protein TM35_000013560 [Trypanosoma theileri]